MTFGRLPERSPSRSVAVRVEYPYSVRSPARRSSVEPCFDGAAREPRSFPPAASGEVAWRYGCQMWLSATG